MTDMNRIEARMNACSKKQEKAFITYITAGLRIWQPQKKSSGRRSAAAAT